jgi:hypothetical protein
MTTTINKINYQRENKKDERANKNKARAETIIKINILVATKITVKTTRTRNLILLITIIAIRTISLLTTIPYTTLIKNN